jgi:carnitine-CoA ligase
MKVLDHFSVEKYPRISDVVDYWAIEKAEKVCIQEVDGRECTYAQLKKEVDSLAAGLHALGISKGSPVLTMMENGLACVEAWLAINKLGAIDVPVHTAYKGYFIKHIINTCEAKYMFVNDRHLETVIDSLDETSHLKVIVVGNDVVEKNRIPANLEIFYFNDIKIPNSTVPAVTCSPDDIGNVLFTSGTKSGTQGLILTYRQLRNTNINGIDRMKLTDNDVSYVCFPMSHGNGKFSSVGTFLLLGATSVILEKFSASRWIYDVHKYQITYTSLMGPMAEFVYKQPPTEFDHNNNLRVILNIPRNSEFTPKFEKRFGVACIEVYGQAGVSAPITSPIGKHQNYASCGTLVEDSYDARLVSPETGKDVGIGETGELWVRPKKEGLISPGYFNDEESYQLAWSGEWFMTGDLMRVDEYGYYYYMGRSGDFIRRRGENVSVKEVEMIIKSISHVLDVAVIGVSTEFITGEDDVMAVIEGEGIDISTLIERCEKELPAFSIPRYWLIAKLPRLPDQTIDKQLIRKRGVTPDTFELKKQGGK